MPRPNPLTGTARSGRRRFPGTRAGLLASAFLAPFSATHLLGPLTVGRAAAIAFAALLALDLLRERPRRFAPSLAAVFLVVGYLGLFAWVFLNSTVWGCNCEGKTGGLLELVVIGVLALIALGFEPEARGSALKASLAGLTLAAALALGGIGSLNSGTVDLTNTGGRLSGTYGNANELGLAAAFGIPIALACLTAVRGLARLVLAGSAAILVLALILTYSRGGVLAAAVGTLALALWEVRGSRRKVVVVLAVAGVTAALGAGLYSIFEDQRVSASFEAVPESLSALDQRDTSGWDGRALGPIPHGPSSLRNSGKGIAVIGNRSGEGVSFRWGEAERGGTYSLRFRARGAAGEPSLEYAVGDRLLHNEVVHRGRLTSSWQPFSITWRPGRPSPHAALYVWQPDRPGKLMLADVRVVADHSGERSVIRAPERLEGSIYDHLTSVASRSEERYLESRLDAARTAWHAFRSAPVQGIGWSTFPDFSAEQLDYGRLAAHDQYLLVAAELGLIGLAFLALLIAAPILGLRRARPGWATSAAIGVLAAALTGMVFVEVLAAPQLAIPIAIAAAVVVAPAQSERTRSATWTSVASEATRSK